MLLILKIAKTASVDPQDVSFSLNDWQLLEFLGKKEHIDVFAGLDRGLIHDFDSDHIALLSLVRERGFYDYSIYVNLSVIEGHFVFELI